jgi:hypothetical protein
MPHSMRVVQLVRYVLQLALGLLQTFVVPSVRRPLV